MSAPVVASAAASYAVLDAAYRAATARTSILVARALLFRWTSVDGDNLAGTSDEFLRDGVRLVLDGQRNAVELANRYTMAVRAVSVPDAIPFTPPPRQPPNEEQIRRSLEYTAIKQTAIELGRIESVRDDEEEDTDSAQRSYEGRREQILRDGIRRAAGAAVRHVTTAGHTQLIENVQNDAVAIGWARTTKPGCCYFCAMLASRGYVYKGDSFEASDAKFGGIGEQKVHDNCGCGLRPIYSPVDPMPDRMEALEQLWADSGSKYSGQRAINEFRKAYGLSDLSKPPTS